MVADHHMLADGASTMGPVDHRRVISYHLPPAATTTLDGMSTQHAAVGRLRPERRDEYLRLHQAVPAAVEALIRRAGISAYRIHEHDGWLFATYTHGGPDHDGDLARMVAHPVMQAWWARCVPCFACTDPAQPWQPLRPVWVLGGGA